MSSRPAWARVCLKKTQQKCHSLSPKQASWGLPQTQQPLLTLVVSVWGDKAFVQKAPPGALEQVCGAARASQPPFGAGLGTSMAVQP
jgi:hypothetical protein